MTELSENCVKCIGRDIWTKDISEIWRLEKTPPEIWYLKNREEFEKRYRDFLSKIPEVTYINFDKNIGTHVATYVNFNTLKEYHDPIVVITDEGISQHEKKIGNRDMTFLFELVHELDERALLKINPKLCYGITAAQRKIFRDAYTSGKLDVEGLIDLGITESIRHSFVNEADIEVLNRRGVDGRKVIMDFYDACVEEDRKKHPNKNFSLETISGNTINDILTREILCNQEHSTKDLRKRAESRKLELTKEEAMTYRTILFSCIGKMGYQL